MSKVERFEDLIAWQKSRVLARTIYALSNSAAFAKDFGLRDQIRRASVSVLSNIAEGFDRSGATEFHRFLVIAKGSCAEVRAQLYVALDAEYITENEFTTTMTLAEETSRIIAGLRKAVAKQKATNTQH